MRKMLAQFRDDDSGAAMVEYSILIGIIAAASIVTVIAIGAWVNGSFSNLCNSLQGVTGVEDCTVAVAPPA
ncbi:Flp family type IVb pilin [Mesorhizobium sp. M7A.T.Ca.TU.009.01.3.2]|nr:Flp family type IVb pilin [Mesorhizobium sp. M7A.T.Ca.TU.009.01.3.2]